MPNGMKIPDLFYRVKNYSDGIEYPARDQKPQAKQAHGVEQRVDSDDDHPTHKDIANDRRLSEFFQVDRVERDTYYGSAPDYAEQSPAERAAQNRKRYRSICPRDKEKYGIVIHYAEKRLCPRV